MHDAHLAAVLNGQLEPNPAVHETPLTLSQPPAGTGRTALSHKGHVGIWVLQKTPVLFLWNDGMARVHACVQPRHFVKKFCINASPREIYKMSNMLQSRIFPGEQKIDAMGFLHTCARVSQDTLPSFEEQGQGPRDCMHPHFTPQSCSLGLVCTGIFCSLLQMYSKGGIGAPTDLHVPLQLSDTATACW